MDKIQSVIIEFSDGETGVFTGPATCSPGTDKRILDIKFTEPIPLPSTCEFTSLDEIKEQHARS